MQCSHDDKIPVHNSENRAYCPQCEEEVQWRSSHHLADKLLDLHYKVITNFIQMIEDDSDTSVVCMPREAWRVYDSIKSSHEYEGLRLLVETKSEGL